MEELRRARDAAELRLRGLDSVKLHRLCDANSATASNDATRCPLAVLYAEDGSRIDDLAYLRARPEDWPIEWYFSLPSSLSYREKFEDLQSIAIAILIEREREEENVATPVV